MYVWCLSIYLYIYLSGLGRFFAETWLGSHPSLHAADCMNVSMSSRYLWGKFPLPWRLVNKKCPNFHTEFMTTTLKYATAAGKDDSDAYIDDGGDIDADEYVDIDAHADVVDP